VVIVNNSYNENNFMYELFGLRYVEYN